MNKRNLLIIEALQKNRQGLTRGEINDILLSEGEQPLDRFNFNRTLTTIDKKWNLKICSRNYGKNVWRYFVEPLANDGDYNHERVVGMLVANMLQVEFLQRFRNLGNKIQPMIIPSGNEYLRTIGAALEDNRKLKASYQKFAAKPYEAILQPYCLKAFDNRWYLFARKENTEHAGDCLQCFALDRICSLKLLPDTFCPDPTIDPLEYFRDA